MKIIVSVAAAWFFATGVVDYYKEDSPIVAFSFALIAAWLAAWMWGL